MADAELIKCPACNRQVSSAAQACPGCGHPIAAGPEAQDEPASTPQAEFHRRPTADDDAKILDWACVRCGAGFLSSGDRVETTEGSICERCNDAARKRPPAATATSPPAKPAMPERPVTPATPARPATPAPLRTEGLTDRISRRQFAWSIWPFKAAALSILLALMAFDFPFVVQIVGMLLLIWIVLAVMYTLAAGRLRDIGGPPGIAWLSFMGPLGIAFVLILQFLPGQRDANTYGPAPYAPGVERPKLPNTIGRVSGVVAVVVWWILVLALEIVGPVVAFALTMGGAVLIVLAWMGVSLYRFRFGDLLKERQPVAKRERVAPHSVAGFRGVHSYADWLDLDIIQREQVEITLTPEERDKLRQMKTIHFKLNT